MREIVPRPMRTQDLDDVVRVHREAFPGFFLTRMGRRFLRSYYQAVLDYEHSIALVAADRTDDRTHGFVVGFQRPEGFYALFSARRRRLVGVIILAVLRDPRLLGQILRNSSRVERRAAESTDAVELASIGVSGRERGMGGRLVEAFCVEAQAAGAGQVVLTTDAEGNDAVRRFYETRGFALDWIEERGGRRLCHYVRDVG